MQEIRTRWHRAKEALASGMVFMSTKEAEAEHVEKLPGVLDKDGLIDFFDMFDSAPKYFFDNACLQTLYARPEQVFKSLQAMAQADVMRLPFPYVLVEYDWGGPTILGLSESKLDAECPYRANAMQLTTVQNKDALLLSPATYYISPVFKDEEGYETMRWRAYSSGWCKETPAARKLGEDATAYWKPMIEPGIVGTMLLLNTRGLTREVVTPGPKLNRKRAKLNRPPIPSHTIIRIGHVYTRSGSRISVDEAERRKQPLHWRAGYTAVRWITKRHEKWQAELADDEGKHSLLVYVEPYLVNYDPLTAADDDLPDIPERTVRW